MTLPIHRTFQKSAAGLATEKRLPTSFRRPVGEELRGDFGNYTDIEPELQLSEVVGSA